MQQQFHRRVSAIVPAYNEERTIGEVIRMLRFHPLIDEVIVVSDGSSDRTADVARQNGADVIALERNVGKGRAMGMGVERAKGDVIAFFDADLIGLTNVMIDQVLRPVLTGAYDMFTLIRDRRSETFQLYLSPYLALGGERALTRSLWESVPEDERTGYSVETALNYFARKNGLAIGIALAEGLGQVPKERKRGFWIGLMHRIGESAEWLTAMIRLHVLRREGKKRYLRFSY